MQRPSHSVTATDLGLVRENDQELIDVLDLPQLYTKPDATSILAALTQLSSEPASWEATPRSGTPRTPRSGISTPHRTRAKVKPEGVPNYLTKIIASPLAWIKDEDQKEQVWEAASQRLSERSGRTAMGALSRIFLIPLRPNRGSPLTLTDCALQDDEYIELTLHEPALTADNLGFKTWASSYLLSKRLAMLQAALPRLPHDASILELGSGTGLVGLAASTIFGRHVLLTDLPEIVPNLARNAVANGGSLSAHEGRTSVAVLDWSTPEKLHLNDSTDDHEAHTFPLILAADPIYSPEHPALLAKAVGHHLSKTLEARVVVEMPLRHGFTRERKDFGAEMKALELLLLDDGEETGYDDWSAGNDEEPLEVRCWWSVWGRG